VREIRPEFDERQLVLWHAAIEDLLGKSSSSRPEFNDRRGLWTNFRSDCLGKSPSRWRNGPDSPRVGDKSVKKREDIGNAGFQFLPDSAESVAESTIDRRVTRL
jgi:hypothetical protein